MRAGVIGDRYLVARRIGAGGMACVFLCWDERLRLWCAIKVMNARVVSDPVQRARFVQEARTLARLQHPNLVRLFDLADGFVCPYMVMEYVAGGTVSARLTRGALTPRQSARVAIDVCEALEVAHGAGVIHRDLKPQNLMLDLSGVVKVGDFGVARVEQALRLTMSDMSLGTLAYMAPEQQRDASKVDLRADLYAVGATLYTLATARRPTPLITGEREKVLAALPPALRPIVAKATESSRRDRYESARELATALRAALPDLADDPAATPLIDRPDPPPLEPPKEGAPGVDVSELAGTDVPFQGGMSLPVGGLPPASTMLSLAPDSTPHDTTVLRGSPRRRSWWGVAALVGAVVVCAGSCTGLAGLGSVGGWFAVVGF